MRGRGHNSAIRYSAESRGEGCQSRHQSFTSDSTNSASTFLVAMHPQGLAQKAFTHGLSRTLAFPPGFGVIQKNCKKSFTPHLTSEVTLCWRVYPSDVLSQEYVESTRGNVGAALLKGDVAHKKRVVRRLPVVYRVHCASTNTTRTAKEYSTEQRIQDHQNGIATKQTLQRKLHFYDHFKHILRL